MNKNMMLNILIGLGFIVAISLCIVILVYEIYIFTILADVLRIITASLN